MNKRVANNARKEKSFNAAIAAQTERDANEIEAQETDRLKTESGKAQAEFHNNAALDANEDRETEQTVTFPKIMVDMTETKDALLSEQDIQDKLRDALNQSSDDLANKLKSDEVKTDEVTKSADEILAEIAAIKLKREQLAKEKAAIREELKKKRDIEKALAALEAEKKALADEESAEVTLEDEASDNAGILGKDYKVSQKAQDELMIAALKANGNTVERIGIAREYWKKHSAEFRAITKEKQQKAIMRRCINRLIASGIVEHEGTRLTLKLEKLEALKTAESK